LNFAVQACGVRSDKPLFAAVPCTSSCGQVSSSVRVFTYPWQERTVRQTHQCYR